MPRVRRKQCVTEVLIAVKFLPLASFSGPAYLLMTGKNFPQIIFNIGKDNSTILLVILLSS